jgi:hypothetical protein
MSTNRPSDGRLRPSGNQTEQVDNVAIIFSCSAKYVADVRARLTVIELGGEFSTSHAGEAAAGLLEKIAARFNPKTA